MTMRSSIIKTMQRALFFALFLSGSANASGLSVEDLCDAKAGSAFDQARNVRFAPVERDAIEIGAALSACREAYNAGGAPRMAFQLGRALERAGQDLDAMALYEDAALRGHTVAMVNYGAMLGKRGDAAGEFRQYEQAAGLGDMLGAYNLAVAYRDGIGTTVDAVAALRWFDVASAAGDGTAAFNLAVLLDDGKAMPADKPRAADFYRLAAARGNVDAMINLGMMLETGDGVPQDRLAAEGYFRAAADRGDNDGKARLEQLQQSKAAVDPITLGAVVQSGG